MYLSPCVWALNSDHLLLILVPTPPRLAISLWGDFFDWLFSAESWSHIGCPFVNKRDVKDGKDGKGFSRHLFRPP